jgi:hypothetical protein
LRKTASWSTTVVTAIALVGLGVYFARIGLERADKIVAVLGGLAGLAGLGVAVVGIILARSDTTPPAEPPIGDGRQVVTRSSVGGDVIQVGEAGDVDIRRG